MRRRLMLVLLGLLAAGCSSSPDLVAATGTDAPATTTAPTTVAPSTLAATTAAPTTAMPTTVAPPDTTVPLAAPLVITEFGIGPALLGMSGDELQAALGPMYSVTPQDDIRVDFSGFNILYEGDIVFSAAASFSGDFVDAFITNHPNIALANGIGPGSRLEEMVAEFGSGVLSFSYSNEGREFFNFDDPVVPDNVFIETRMADGSRAGIYADDDDDFNQTTEFDPDGEVAAIWLSCTPPEGFNPCPE